MRVRILVSIDPLLDASLVRWGAAAAYKSAADLLRILVSHRKKGGRSVALSLFFCSDVTISKLNKQWFGRCRPTNVISFRSPWIQTAIEKLGPVPIKKGGLVKYLAEEKGEIALLGDIAISLERALEEAAGSKEWPSHLAQHGLFHLLGYNHKKMPLYF